MLQSGRQDFQNKVYSHKNFNPISGFHFILQKKKSMYYQCQAHNAENYITQKSVYH